MENIIEMSKSEWTWRQKRGCHGNKWYPCSSIFSESCSPINFSKTRRILLVLIKHHRNYRKLKSVPALWTPPPPSPSLNRELKAFPCRKQKWSFKWIDQKPHGQYLYGPFQVHSQLTVAVRALEGLHSPPMWKSLPIKSSWLFSHR